MSFFTELKRRNVIRVALGYGVLSWLLLQVSDVLVQALELSPVLSKTVIAALAIGFIPVLVFSWVYEMTPQGLKRESEITQDRSITTHTARKLNIAIVVLLAAAVALFAVDRFSGHRGPAPELVSALPESVPAELSKAPAEIEADEALALGVAVLPFDNLSADAENAFFASGVHEDVLTYLSRVADLRVISRTSVENYVSSELSLPEIGRELGVSHVVEGSVRRSADRVRVTVQLIDVETDAHVWSENYDRTLTDIFAIQTEIAQAIVGQLEAELSPEEAAQLAAIPTDSIEAYEAFLRARERWNQEVNAEQDYSGLVAIGDAYLLATRLDPEFLEAWLGVVQVAGIAVWVNVDVKINQQRAADALARMRAIAPDAGETHQAAAIYAYRVQRDLPTALVHVERAIIALPNLVHAHSIRALVARRLGLWESAELAARRAVELDPASIDAHRTLLEVLSNAQVHEALAVAAAEAARRFPDIADFRVYHATALAEVDGSVSELAALVPTLPARGRAIFAARFKGVFDGPQDVLAWLQRDEGEAEGFDEIALAVTSAYYLRQVGEDEAARSRLRRVLGHPLMLERKDAWGLGTLLHVAADLGDQEEAARLRSELTALTRDTEDVFMRNVSINALAYARAAMGDPEGAWQDMAPLIGQPGGPSEWGLVLGVAPRSMFENVPGYRAHVARMEGHLGSE